MKLTQETEAHLRGEKFSRGFSASFEFEPSDAHYRNRQDLLVELCRGGRIIHAGCVDHSIELMREKIGAGTWLHGRLAEVAKRCVGVDIARDGVAYMRDELGYADVIEGDIAGDGWDLPPQSDWDYLLMPELVEHIDNPVQFLRAVAGRFRAKVEKVILGVPNALSRGNYRRALEGRELINSDHRYWFTPYTIAKVAVRAGLRVERIMLATQSPIRSCGFLTKLYYSRRPLVRDSIIVVTAIP